MKRDHRERLIDIGSTTALNAMVEIVSNRSDSGELARQAQQMLSRLSPAQTVAALEGFCDELQTFIESVPGAKLARIEKRRGRAASR